MCLAVFAYDSCPNFSLIVAFNRDEDFTRETKPAHWWDGVDVPEFRETFGATEKVLLGGKDCVAGGTWLCCNRLTKRVSFLLNGRPGLRSDSFKTVGQPTRGELPVLSCLHDKGELNEFLSRGLRKERYAPFHLVTAELTSEKLEMYYTTNNGRGDNLVAVSRGIHALSNLDMDGSWPKVTRAKEKFKDMVDNGVFSGDEFPWDSVFSCMKDVSKNDPMNQNTIFVEPIQLGDGRIWGTRSITVVVVHRNGRVEYKEQSLVGSASPCLWQETYHHFTIN